MMRQLLLVMVVVAAPLAAHANGFVPGTEDLPLMPGLVSITSSAVVFDNPEGRIVDVSARGKVTRYHVIRFYTQTLRQLGWRHVPRTTATWTRSGERLHLNFRGTDGDLTVEFTLAP